MRMTRWLVRSYAVAMMAFMLGIGTGCESGGGGDSSSDDSTSGGGAVAGTWLITKEGKPAYWTFNDDGTFTKYRADEPIGGSVHFTGTYSSNGNSFSGEFRNAGVGNGEIEGTVDGDSLTMNFIEYWHSPAKVVPCVGDRQ